ncbi:MAG: NusG domain II-containing protein [Spirochaetaceae bacterium]|nr:NusG domain II-containing protein [Spirochaetaceae bacterium]
MIKFKVVDIITILLSMTAAFVAGFIIYGNYSPPELLEITCRDGTMIYPIGQDKDLSIKGPHGDSIIVIENKQAYFRYSPCPDKLCVKSGHLGKSGEWAGCLPNMIFIRIMGQGEVKAENEKIDTLSY